MSAENSETNSQTPAAPLHAAAETELAALKAQLAETAAKVLAGVPEHLRGLVPANLSPADQIDWFNQAKATGIFHKPAVPPTDGGARPAITPTAPDTASLPVYARMAAGYAPRA
jgi:hypothetical protein